MIKKLNHPYIIIFLCVTFVVIECLFMFVLMPELNATGDTMIDMKYYNSTIFYETLDRYGEEGLQIYNWLQLLDMVFPAVYGLLLSVILYRLKFKLYHLPLLVAMFDYLENIGIRFLIITRLETIPNVVFIFTVLKFLGLLLSFGIILVLRLKKGRQSYKSM